MAIYQDFNSGNVQQFEYPDTGEEETLRVTFQNGSVYEYERVPRTVLDALLITANSGGSVGREFHRLVIKAGFEGRRVDE